MRITYNNKPNADIVIPDKPTKREIFAADELRKYIKMISKASLRILTSNESIIENKILIGGPERNKITASCITEEQFDKLIPGPDGVMIKSFYRHVLIIAGSSKNPGENERGTVYAVYEFLERFLGCSFVAYGRPDTGSGEYIPLNNNIEICELNYVKSRADLTYRTAITQGDGYNHKISNADANHALTASLVDWMAKNRLNRIFIPMYYYYQIKVNGVLAELDKRGISISAGHHDSGTFFLPPQGNSCFNEKYYETHPEYFRMQPDGTRYLSVTKWKEQLVYDMRNRECINQMADNMKLWLQDNPLVDIISLWPNDGDAPQCACKKCMKYDKMTNYTWFVNEVANLVGKEYPNVKVGMIVYLDLWELPLNVEIGRNVLVEMSTWGPGYILRPFGKNDGSGLIGTAIELNALKWSTRSGGMVYYDYYMTNFDSEQVYCPMADEIIKIYESFINKRYCQGSGTQLEAYNLWNYLFNFYTHGRKAYDISFNINMLLERFIKIFGMGAEYIKEYISYIEVFNNGQESDGKKCAEWFAENVDHDKVYNLFEQAFNIEPDNNLRNNIRLLRMAFRYSDLHTRHHNCDELKYISENFGSYWSVDGQSGYGIAIFDKPENNNFIPDKWYLFEEMKR